MSDSTYEHRSDSRYVSGRDTLLKQWVKQSPASPIVQYLRDAERLTALKQLGDRVNTLDVASESNVTRSLRSEQVTRLDFSPAASDYARESLGRSVDRFALTDPEFPRLPFEDDTFDSAVSIGPFDWKFLDVHLLTEELHRVVDDDGRVVFSVPTTRSPYAVADRNRFRYVTPEEAHSLVPLDWRLTEYDLLFQYPSLVHRHVGKLPLGLQERLVDFAWNLSGRLTARSAWERASYLVFGIEPLDYERYLDSALACLFRPIENDGFWDDGEGKIIRALEYELNGDDLVWTPDDTVQWRYAPFAIMGVLRWRASALASGRYDAKIQRQLEYFAERVGDGTTVDAMPSYGIGPLVVAFSLAGLTFDEPRYTAIARQLYEYSAERFDFTHAEDSLLVFGWAHLYDSDPDEQIRADIAEAIWMINERLTPEQLFRFENPTTRRHQNQMYTLWGLCEGIRTTGVSGYLDSVEQVLDYTIEHRMRDDGAFIWEDVPLQRRLKRIVLGRAGDRPPHWDFLYECHQTFFINAVTSYYRAGGTNDYDRAVREAMSWIYGDNCLKADLVEYSGLGVPMRQMTVDARMDVPDQTYKGTYEIGSYVMALTDLLSDDPPR